MLQEMFARNDKIFTEHTVFRPRISRYSKNDTNWTCDILFDHNRKAIMKVVDWSILWCLFDVRTRASVFCSGILVIVWLSKWLFTSWKSMWSELWSIDYVANSNWSKSNMSSGQVTNKEWTRSIIITTYKKKKEKLYI